MTITEYFEELKTKDIYCYGSGKHFRNNTLPFLQKSGLLECLKGFVDPAGTGEIQIGDHTYPRITKDELIKADPDRTLILIAVTGYEEILQQLRAEEKLARFEAVPAIFLEALYEDTLLLSADKPPAGYRRHDHPVIPKVIHAIWFSGDPMPPLYEYCLESWKQYAPDYEVKIWNMETYRPEKCLFYDQAIEHRNWAFASDYA
ncbi:MAG: capsular polysaccharide synthesis protein, partial [Lachnospiraceae bacterium]|nr:capsular polysaccharide synthesis protein [Lachnospiraceae bacterium]